jgi:RNA polymerase sigma-70 factor, ECF subfamily
VGRVSNLPKTCQKVGRLEICPTLNAVHVSFRNKKLFFPKKIGQPSADLRKPPRLLIRMELRGFNHPVVFVGDSSSMAISPDDFVALYTQHERRLYRYVASLLTHPDDADDLLQETARVLWQKIDQYDPARPFFPWACKIAHFEVLNYYQRERTRQRHFSEATVELLADSRAENDGILEAQSRWLVECMRRLAEMDRVLVEQRYASEHSLADLAQATGRTPNAIYKSMQRIRRNLMECIENGLKSEGWK